MRRAHRPAGRSCSPRPGRAECRARVLLPVWAPAAAVCPDGTRARRGVPSAVVPDVLSASDAEWVHRDVRAVLADSDTTVRSVYSGPAVLPACQSQLPDLAVLDLQIGNMGAMA